MPIAGLARWKRIAVRAITPTDQLGGDEVRGFLTELAVRHGVAASTQNQAFNALLFFFRHVLRRDAPRREPERREGMGEPRARSQCTSRCSPRSKRNAAVSG